MKEADGYLMIPPEYIDGYEEGKVKNVHIFNCSNTDDRWHVAHRARCNNVLRDDCLSGLKDCIKTSAEEIRRQAVDVENKGWETVCGQCVATLYSDGK